MYLSRANPSVEPLSLTEAKTWLRVSGSAEDSLIEALIQTARDQVEEYTCRTLVNRTCTLKLEDEEVQEADIWLPYGPVSAITSVTSYTTDDVGTAESADDYYLAGDRLVQEGSWTSERDFASVVVIYTAGYGSGRDDLPAGLVHAVRVCLTDLFEMRQSEVVGTVVAASKSGTWQNFAEPYRQGHLSTWH